jgi:hypothetical protein
MSLEDRILSVVHQLIGLRLGLARNAGAMKVLHFGNIRPHPSGKGNVGDYALHIQCPWRIVSSEAIVTGSKDLAEPPEAMPNFDWNSALHEKDGNLQNKRLGELMGGYDTSTRSYVNNAELLVVTEAQADCYSSVRVRLSPNYYIEVLPCGSSEGEDWRWLRPGDPSQQFAVGGGQVLNI